MKKYFLSLLIITISTTGFSQLFMARNGFVGFYSKTPMEDVQAENHQLYAIIDIPKKTMAFTVLIKGFIFSRQLMQEHFNENYAESDKYPKASFDGTYTGDVTIGKDGVYNIIAKGSFTFHGVTKQIEEPATLEVKQGKLLGNCTFKMKPEDYNISIPSIVRDKVASEITIAIKIECSPR